jgi:hypothetical protein
VDLTAFRKVDSRPLLESFRVMSGDPVTMRKLSAGDYRAGSLHNQEGSLLRIRLEPGRLESSGTQPEFVTADLVEVTCSQTLCLGEVQGREGELLIVRVEHSLDRAALAAIQQVWYRPATE